MQTKPCFQQRTSRARPYKGRSRCTLRAKRQPRLRCRGVPGLIGSKGADPGATARDLGAILRALGSHWWI